MTTAEDPSANAARRDELRVLLLAPVGRDAEITRSILSQAGIESEACRGVATWCRGIALGAGAVLVVEEVLTPSHVGALAAALEQQPPWSDIPLVVVTSGEPNQVATLATLSRIERLGNVTLVDRPVRLITMTRAIWVALRARRRQYELRDLLLRLEGEVRQRDEFLAMLGHELRNPLTAIAYALHMLKAVKGDEDRAARQQAIIARQSGHLSRLVDDLLDVARLTSGKIAISTAPIDLGELARRALQSVEGDAAHRGVALALHESAAPVKLRGDAVRIEQVLANMLTNGIKYTPRGGRVDVDVDSEQDRAVLRVRDTGVGIAPDVLPTIFDLFKQADWTLDRSRGGLGIGLTLVRRLVEMHGGTVIASSRGIGEGSEFTVYLPLAEANAGAQDPSSAAAPSDPSAEAPHHLLVVEDNDDVRTSLQEMLEAAGHVVEVAADGVSAITRALEAKPQAMLVDIGLPGCDGYEVARRVRAALGSRVLLVAVTGYGQPEDRRRALASGFDMHITKPASLEVVQRVLREVPLPSE